ncbi:DinB family protein [Actinoplanes sp. NPDC023801]|uniref:DinB family protein n=1 Tax=Actinoplanes sp. NPDC023801 TaxID=3154595 RepID=UPI003406B6E5
MTIDFPSPTVPAANRADVFTGYLDFFRESLLAKTATLPEAELRTSRLPSGWTPLELVKHLRHVERRWIEWGFQGRDVGDPWADQRDDRWHVTDEETLAQLTAELRAQGVHTTEVITTNDLDEAGRPGDRWEGADPATLERICFHLVQEYARHLGHLDIVAELAGAATGE